MADQLAFGLGKQFEPVKTHKSGAYTATYRKGDTHANVTHVSDPKNVIDTIPLGSAPARALKEWHEKTKLNYR